MNESKFNPEEMPILNLDTSGTSLYEASRFLDSPETISAYLAESMKAQDPQMLMKALAEVAKAQGVNKVAQEAGVNRESLYKSLKGGAKTRFETVKKLLMAVGVELTVQPIAANAPAPNFAKPAAAAAKPTAAVAQKTASAKPAAAVAKKPAAAKIAAAAKPAVPKPAASKTRRGRAIAAARGEKGQVEVEDSLAAG
jgi:probable addiction module antidote protein